MTKLVKYVPLLVGVAAGAAAGTVTGAPWWADAVLSVLVWSRLGRIRKGGGW
jgi:hypothetical protein